jgi:hypothetical protein
MINRLTYVNSAYLGVFNVLASDFSGGTLEWIVKAAFIRDRFYNGKFRLICNYFSDLSRRNDKTFYINLNNFLFNGSNIFKMLKGSDH